MILVTYLMASVGLGLGLGAWAGMTWDAYRARRWGYMLLNGVNASACLVATLLLHNLLPPH